MSESREIVEQDPEEVLRRELLKPNDRIVTDRKLLREQAVLGLFDAYYLGMQILGLSKDEFPAPPEEIEPYYKWLDQERPQRLHPKAKWLRFWASPRFTRKTYSTAVWLTQQIIRYPNIRIIIDGQERQNAGDTVMLIRDWLEMPELVRLYGNFVSESWGKFEFTVSQRNRAQRDPTLRALGLDNSEQGKRCDVRWWDDLIGKTNNNPEGIRKVEQHISAGMPIIKPGGMALYTCTRWNALDPSTEGFTVSGNMGILRQWKQGMAWDAPPPRGWFSAYAQAGDEVFYPQAKVGELLYPSVLPEEVLAGERTNMTPPEFASQYLNNPYANEERPFSAEDILHFDPVDENGQRSEMLLGAIPYVAVDPASGKLASVTKDDSTFCAAYIKWFEHYFHVYVVEWEGGRWPDTRIQDTVFNYLQMYKPRAIFVEVNIGRDFIVAPWRRKAMELGVHLPLHDYSASLHGTGKKDARIPNTLGDLYRAHRIYHARKLKNSKAEDQLIRWTPGGAGHDDYPDVLAALVFHATQKRQATLQSQRARVIGLTAPNRYRTTGM